MKTKPTNVMMIDVGGQIVELTFTHYRLLYCADSASLPELLGGLKTYGFPENVEWPALPLREARKGLLQLVQIGYIDVLARGGAVLSRATAAQVLKRDAPWQNLPLDSPDYFEVWANEEGAEVFKALKTRFGDVGVIGKVSKEVDEKGRKGRQPRKSGRRRK
ncbi:MAG TPA: hypothetical protein VK488_15105 [Gaiellaceae bacterium]|nr:hypothetical protein [Gaiellaceae bacterium]